MSEQVMRYRYEDNVTEDGVELNLIQFREVKKTPRGAWVERYWGNSGWWSNHKRFVLDGDGRRYCHQTKELAWESFKIRKQRQKQHADLALARAEFALEQIEKLGSAPEATIMLGKPDIWCRYTFE